MSGLVVNPGQTIDIAVSVSGPYSRVVLSGPSPVLTGETQLLNSPPYLFHATLAPDSAPGRWGITVSLHSNKTFSLIASDEAFIDVERPDPPRAIRIESGSSTLPIGSVTDLIVFGIFEGGEEVRLNPSTRTSYDVEPQGIVSVTKQGGVTALSPGTARITVHYEKIKASLDVSVVNDGLKITSPPAGTVVHFGETITVDVDASGGPFKFVGIMIPDMPGLGGEPRFSPPYTFSISIPKWSPGTRRPGVTSMAVVGTGPSGNVYGGIPIDIEREDSPKAISVDPPEMDMELGEGLYLDVDGTYPDGSIVRLGESTETKYEPASPGVVSVSSEGFVKALAPGSTTITVRHRDQKATVKVVVRDGDN